MGIVEFSYDLERKLSFWIIAVLLFFLVIMLGSSFESLGVIIAAFGLAFVIFYISISKYIS